MHSIRALLLLFCIAGLTACGNSASRPNNSAPVATDVSIIDANGGQVWVGDQLYGSYNYIDPEGDPEGATTFNWYRNGVVISDTNALSYTIAEDDVGQRISLQVMPAARTGSAIGIPIYSDELSVDYFIGTRLPPQLFTSVHTQGTYTISLYLPEGYATSARDYPVIYEFASESSFNLHADILDAKAQQVILVSVNSGSERWVGDMTMPGARSLYDFFVLELVPFIDVQYRTDKKNRTLAGHSLGGLFVGLAMLFELPGARNFSAFVSSDGTFSDQPEETRALEQQLAENVSELPVTLILTAATGSSGNLFSVTGFHWELSQRNYTGFRLIYMPFDLRHEEIYGPSFAAAIDILFP